MPPSLIPGRVSLFLFQTGHKDLLHPEYAKHLCVDLLPHGALTQLSNWQIQLRRSSRGAPPTDQFLPLGPGPIPSCPRPDQSLWDNRVRPDASVRTSPSPTSSSTLSGA